MPGTGKSATAEAIAQANGKPLFPITCGDLGLTPNEVENALRRIFRLANAWDCVLLLDEVDTFFSQRSKGGDSALAKNALVSGAFHYLKILSPGGVLNNLSTALVFLRVLEYYNGLLFLTTNRTGTLDEAFKTRIHLKLYYGHLEHEQTLQIWQMNLERLRQIEKQRCEGTAEQPLDIREDEILAFADRQYRQATKDKRWSGRQIRNAFQVAASLAYFGARSPQIERPEGQSSDETVASAPRPRLDVTHFEMIHAITDEFEEYVQETTGRTASKMAHERDERADDFELKPKLTVTPPTSLSGHHRNGSWGRGHGAYGSESGYRFESTTAEGYSVKSPVSLARPVSPAAGSRHWGRQPGPGSYDLDVPGPPPVGPSKRKFDSQQEYEADARYSMPGGSYRGYHGHGGEHRVLGKDAEYR